MNQRDKIGHLVAIITITIWATTFISTKVLLVDFRPVEILVSRFLIGYLILCFIRPGKITFYGWKQEFYFLLAGFCGIFIYYLLENIALTYTRASNVGVIISVAPFFTAFLLSMGGKKTRLGTRFLTGFLVAMVGIGLISLKESHIQIDPFGDLLALLAAFSWACYSVLTKKIAEFGHDSVQVTRKVFAYGLLFMLPVMFTMGGNWSWRRFTDPVNLGNILFLGVGASALCFVSWNYAVKVLGAIKTSLYIYLVPVITVLASVLILKEPISAKIIGGIVLTIAGLVISNDKVDRPVLVKSKSSVRI